MGNLVFQATLGGQVNLVGPNTASTYNLNVPAVSSTIATTSGTETLTNKTLTTPVINGFTGDTSVVNIGSGQFYKDTSGNLGLGVTPSAWANSRAIDVGGFGALSTDTLNDANTSLSWNAYATAYNAWKYKNTGSSASKYTQEAGKHYWYTAASGTAGNAITFTQAMTLDASGNLLVGTTSGSGDKVYVSGYVRSSSGFKTDGSTWIDSPASEVMRFVTNSSERARIDSSGNLLVGATSTGGSKFEVYAATEVARFYNTSGTGNIRFVTSANSTIGYIQWSGSSTAYVTSSDYRLKENIQPMTGALATVAQLKPCTYKWKVDGSDGQGFIAHELQAVVPDAVVGEKDAINEDGSINAQGIDTSFLVATLTAAIQEQQAIIETLTNRITALEQA